MKVAGAPISWGVVEAPAWGHQMTPERVLTEMRAIGLAATEFGPDGFLPDEPQERAALLAGYDLAPVGGFLPVLLHDPTTDLAAALRPFQEGDVVVLAADGGVGYDRRVELDDAQWRTLLGNLERIGDAAGTRGLTVTLHPHVGTAVERAEHVERVLDGSAVPLCLDTGHLLIGGTDPAKLATEAPERIAHCHLKDVDLAVAARVRDGELTYTEAVRQGLYRPLGAGDADIAAVVEALEAAGYDGWYVLEQDTVVTAEPPAGEGPAGDVRASLEYLKGLPWS